MTIGTAARAVQGSRWVGRADRPTDWTDAIAPSAIESSANCHPSDLDMPAMKAPAVPTPSANIRSRGEQSRPAPYAAAEAATQPEMVVPEGLLLAKKNSATGVLAMSRNHQDRHRSAPFSTMPASTSRDADTMNAITRSTTSERSASSPTKSRAKA